MKKNILVDIGINYNQLTRKEKKVADYVTQNPDKVIFMSITELADECDVAEATIHRFCRTVKTKGYQEFKMLLSLTGSGGDDLKVSDKNSNISGTDMYDKILENHIASLQETRSLLDPSVVEATVSIMKASKRLIFTGVGNSMITAEAAAGKFLHITPKAQYIIDTHMQSIAASMMDTNDMVIIFSYSGDTSDNAHVACIAKKTGAKVSVITRYPKSKLTKYADTVLICGSKEGPLEGGSMGAKMSQLYIIDILFQCYYNATLKESRKYNELTAKANVDKFI